MKIVILAGGLPSTITEEVEKIPKPMAEIGGRPVLWHIMKLFSYYGYNDFIICTGYKGNLIKEYFMDYYVFQSDITVDLKTNHIEVHRKNTEDWKVTLIDTGLKTSICQRIGMIEDLIKEDSFILSYGDCLSDVDVNKLVECHSNNQKITTTTVARPIGRSAIVPIDENGELIYEKKSSQKQNAWVNAGIMVLKKQIFQYIKPEDVLLENGPFERLCMEKQLGSYCHNGFWSTIETKRDYGMLEQMWKEKRAPWKTWE